MHNGVSWISELATCSMWRQPDQLRGLQAGHSSALHERTRLANLGTVTTASELCMHPLGDAVAVALSPLGRGGSIGLMPLVADGVASRCATLDFAPTSVWLDLPDSVPCTSVCWCEDLLLVGSTRGRILIGDYPRESCLDQGVGGAFSPGGVLQADPHETAVGSISLSPSGPAAHTGARSVRTSLVTPTDVCAAYRSTVVTWDLNGEASTTFSLDPFSADAAVDNTPVTCATFAPSSASVLAAGSFLGSPISNSARACLIDRRCDTSRPSRWLVLPASATAGEKRGAAVGNSVTCMQFHPLVHYALATSTRDGCVHVTDLRFAHEPVFSIRTGHGSVSSIAWDGTHADMLFSAGIDGTVRLWNLRAAPTLCVGKWVHRLPVMSVVVTDRFVQPRCIGLTGDGELGLCGLASDAMVSLAPKAVPAFLCPSASTSATGTKDMSNSDNGAPMVLLKSAAASSSGSALHQAAPQKRAVDASGGVESDEAIKRTIAALFLRDIRGAMKAIVEGTTRALSLKHFSAAQVLLSLTESISVPAFDMDLNLSAHRDNLFANELLSSVKCRELFLSELLAFSCKLPLPPGGSAADDADQSPPLRNPFVESLRGYEKPDPIVAARLEALQRTLAMRRSLDAEDAVALSVQLRQLCSAIRAAPAIVELVNADTLCDVVMWLVDDNSPDRLSTFGIPLTSDLLDALVTETSSGDAAAGWSTPSKSLVRRVMTAALSPLVTDMLPLSTPSTRDAPRDAERRKRHVVEGCFKNLLEAKKACVVQLRVRALGVTKPSEIVALVSEYHEACAQRHEEADDDAEQDGDEMTNDERRKRKRRDSAAAFVGVFGWLSAKALLLYLNSLCAPHTSRLAAFLWTSVQLIDHYGGMSGVTREMEALYFTTLDRLRSSSQRCREDLARAIPSIRVTTAGADDDDDGTVATNSDNEDYAGASKGASRRVAAAQRPTESMTASQVRSAEPAFVRTHQFVEALLRLMLECESIAIDAGLEDESLPPLVKSGTELLNKCCTDLLETWADALQAVADSRQLAAIKQQPGGVLSLVKQFTKSVTALIDVSPQGEDDSTIRSILELCDDFVATIATAKQR